MTYRQEFLTRITKLILRGESVFLFGPPGIGKTSDVQYLFQDNTARKTYFGASNTNFLWLNADEIQEENQKNYLAQLSNLHRDKPDHAVIVIDHADRLINSKLTSLFSAIRSLRESTRPKTCAVFLSDQNIPKSQNLGSLAPLQSLLLENLITVPALNLADSEISLAIWSKYYDTIVPRSDREKIIKMAGGVPRLIKRLVKLYADKQDLDSVISNPALDPKLKLDLEKIAAFNRSNPESTYSVPLLDKLETLATDHTDEIGSIKFYGRLSRQEFDLAACLVGKKDEFVSREEMIKAVWPKNLYETSEHALDQMLHRLRKKLETAIPKPNLITYRGRGCKLET